MPSPRALGQFPQNTKTHYFCPFELPSFFKDFWLLKKFGKSKSSGSKKKENTREGKKSTQFHTKKKNPQVSDDFLSWGQRLLCCSVAFQDLNASKQRWLRGVDGSTASSLLRHILRGRDLGRQKLPYGIHASHRRCWHSLPEAGCWGVLAHDFFGKRG